MSGTRVFLGRTACKESPIPSRAIGRRAFVARAFAIGALWRSRNVVWGEFGPALRVGVVLSSGDADSPVILGARLGAEEASHSAALFGAAGMELTLGTVDEIARRGVAAMIATDASIDACVDIAEAAARHGTLFVNATCGDDELRGEKCHASAFHVAPSNAMLADAVTEVRQHDPVAQGLAAKAWDSSLDRFGADTLNNRFLVRFNRPMTADAWCAWVAMKILGEASLRARSVAPRAIGAYLRGATAQFDGHKGRPLSFRPWDNQLRQPVYVIAPASGSARRLIIESPAPGSTGATSREVLDRIGTGATNSTCRISP
jgi:hypothetical protein